jgi:hypothetical protein
MATNVPPLQFSFARAFGMIQVLPPGCQLGAQPVEIEFGERAVRAVEIAHGTLENRARAHIVAFGVVMKSDRQLNHTLEVPARRAMKGCLAPDVFEDFVGVEKVGAVEQIETSVELCLVVRNGHTGQPPAITLLCQLLCLTIYVFP